MTANPAARERIVTLDVIRGIAVMGIFSVNVVGMAMLDSAYFYPPAFGFDALGDRVMWLVNFLFVDGKMRSLFSIIFGASVILVMEAARTAGRNPWKTHYARMIVLLILGFLHFALLWWGDILAHYAAVGMVAALFAKLKVRLLFILSIAGIVLHAAPAAVFFPREAAEYQRSLQPDAPADIKKKWQERLQGLKPDAAKIAKDRAEHRSIPAHVTAAMDEPLEPLSLGPLWFETLALMLLGMAGYKSGFLTGEWQDRRYRKVAAIGLGIGFFVYAALAAWAWSADFAPLSFFAGTQVISVPFRPVMAMGYAALFILMFRNRSALRDRLAAVGRTAFTNYLGCTFIGTIVFFGFGLDLYAKLSRGEAWLLVPPVWALMLLWSKWWLDRFIYGPFEWLWRSLSRFELQPMRRAQITRSAALPA